MPEFVKSRVGSLPGTSGADGTMVWPLEAKKSRKSRRMSEVLTLGGMFMDACSGGRAHGAAATPQHADAEPSLQPNFRSLQGYSRVPGVQSWSGRPCNAVRTCSM